MLAMGLVEGVEKQTERGPECPPVFITTLDKYRELKFIQRDKGDTIVSYPREMLTWQDLVAYKSITGQAISMLEAELIMGIDAIFEGRNDV